MVMHMSTDPPPADPAAGPRGDELQPTAAPPARDTTALLALLGLVLAAAPKVLEVLRRPRR